MFGRVPLRPCSKKGLPEQNGSPNLGVNRLPEQKGAYDLIWRPYGNTHTVRICVPAPVAPCLKLMARGLVATQEAEETTGAHRHATAQQVIHPAGRRQLAC